MLDEIGELEEGQGVGRAAGALLVERPHEAVLVADVPRLVFVGIVEQAVAGLGRDADAQIGHAAVPAALVDRRLEFLLGLDPPRYRAEQHPEARLLAEHHLAEVRAVVGHGALEVAGGPRVGGRTRHPDAEVADRAAQAQPLVEQRAPGKRAGTSPGEPHGLRRRDRPEDQLALEPRDTVEPARLGPVVRLAGPRANPEQDTEPGEDQEPDHSPS
ncbi:MAG: hypothetical protein JRI25_30060 [Deltaproteobacteria bacterium]|nr:hypothetical protein [Deltaproteobacteria bacterium]